MKNTHIIHFIARRLMLVAIFALLAVFSFAQDTGNPAPRQRQFAPQGPGAQLNLFRALGLTPEQAIQFRRLNAAARPRREQAQRRLREANRELDAVIYADTVNNEDFEKRLSAFQEAQSEVTRLKFTDELAIRNILSPEQLIKFRELRRRAAESLVDGPQRRALRRRAPTPDNPPAKEDPALN